MGNLENVSSRSIEETHKDRVTQKEGGGLRGRKGGSGSSKGRVKVVRRKDHIKAGQGSWEERRKGRMKGGKRGVRVQGRVSSYTFLSDQCEISIVHLLFQT